jgi:hypothetical protein
VRKKEFTEEMRVHFNGLIKTITQFADKEDIEGKGSQFNELCSMLVYFSIGCESEISYPEKKYRLCQKRELTPFNIVAEAEEDLYRVTGSTPSIRDMSNYLNTQERILKMFLMRYKDNFALKDIGLAFGIGADRITQLLHRFSHDLLLFYCWDQNRKNKSSNICCRA